MTTKALALTLALCFAGAATALAQSPQMGTWKLNEAKSKISAGAPKNTTVVYEAQGDTIKITTDGTGMDGSPATPSGPASSTAKTTPSRATTPAETPAPTLRPTTTPSPLP